MEEHVDLGAGSEAWQLGRGVPASRFVELGLEQAGGYQGRRGRVGTVIGSGGMLIRGLVLGVVGRVVGPGCVVVVMAPAGIVAAVCWSEDAGRVFGVGTLNLEGRG